ncbi:MAG: hypothetical protein NWF14_09435 [Candidatus Bathyarchaeota archaeon]|nr:hypothetical protein [Candidatus Bathyarchaeota archaeon]
MPRGTQKKVSLELENIGCLKHIELKIEPGLNIIKAPNASGKTSLIRGLTSMFSDTVPPSHILSLDAVNGGIKIQYGEKPYEKSLRRTPSGLVVASGGMLPFADHRAFDACVALAETGVVHKITGGGAVFREYLENLSYGKYYSAIISVAQELVNELSRELAGPIFKKFESLPLLLTELTELHIKRDHVREKTENLKAAHEADAQKLFKETEEKASALSREEMTLSELKRNLAHEEEKERQLLGFLKLTDDSKKVATQIKDGVSESKDRQNRVKEEITKQTKLLKNLRRGVETMKDQIEQKKNEEIKGLEDLEKELERINKAIILKEEEIQQAESFPANDPKYPGRLAIEVRSEMMKKIEWLDKVVEYFQGKYMRRMTSARLRFNRNATKAFEELGLKGFENVFLDQDFTLHIVRENSVQQPVETLSASEKLTVSLVLMLAAKETFLPDFPFFIIDELTLSYDPERFKQIVNYLRRQVPYVIVTSLTSQGTGKPQVLYEP